MIALSIWLAVTVVTVALILAFKEDNLDYIIEFLLGAFLVILIWIITTV